MKKIYWFMLIFYIGLYILPLSFRPLIIPDEFRYAEIPREMIASRHWASPHLNGLHYFEKPVMGYWLTAGSLLLCGENAFGVRLPSALAAGICALMVFALMRRFHKRSETVLLSAFILLTSLEFYAIAMFAVLDGPLTLFAVLTVGVLLFSQLSGFLEVKVFGAKETWKWVLACGAILTAGSIWLLSIRTADFWKRIALFGAAPLCFLIGSHFILPELTLESKAPEAFLRQQAGRIGPDTLLVSDETLAKAVCWVYGRNNVLLLERAGELSYGLSYKDSGERLLNMAKFDSLVAEKKNKGRIALFIGNNLYAEFEKQMPLPAHKEQYGDFIFFQF